MTPPRNPTVEEGLRYRANANLNRYVDKQSGVNAFDLKIQNWLTESVEK